MCGIIGHIGPRNSVEIVLEGLARLEYRGYDSAGISFVDHRNKMRFFKTTGKVEKLTDLLGKNKYISQASIGHTRWATHGEVNVINAHPHVQGKISVVHNGIIENYQDLKGGLLESGYNFLSDTDSEVFLALVIDEINSSKSVMDAVAKAFGKVKGNSAFVVLDGDSKNILAIKRGAPLVCGICDANSQVLVSSDPYALVGLAKKVYFPEDGVICSLSGGNLNLLNFFECDGSSSRRYVKRVPQTGLSVSHKGDYEHFMLKEIHEQPGLIRALGNYYFAGEGRPLLEELSQPNLSFAHIIACGTAYYAGLTFAQYLKWFNKIRTNVELASEFRYNNSPLRTDDLAIFVSQSGETADTLAAQNFCRKQGLKTLALVNVEESELYRSSDYRLPIRAGMEIGVASTKGFTQMVLTGRLLSFALEGRLDQEQEIQKLVDKFYLLADRIDGLLKDTGRISGIAEDIHDCKGYFYTGRGVYFPVALEGALKLKEIAYVHAEGYAAGELKHGPIALIDHEMVNIAIIGPELYDKTFSNIQEVKSRKGIIVGVGPENDQRLEELSDFFIPVNLDGLEEFSPLLVNIVNQLLAYYMARFKGTDIDRPRNLAKSVTVE